MFDLHYVEWGKGNGILLLRFSNRTAFGTQRGQSCCMAAGFDGRRAEWENKECSAVILVQTPQFNVSF